MDRSTLLRLMYDPAEILRLCGMPPDAWQLDFLTSVARQTLLNITRGGGKSQAVSAVALHTALFRPASTTLIISPGQRQSSKVFQKVIRAYNTIDRPVKATYETQLKLELDNAARIICLPGKEETVRSYHPDLILIDEAARVPDDLYFAVRPMLNIRKARLVALSTPFGQRGWFYREWVSNEDWKRIRVTATDHPRIDPADVAADLRRMGQAWIDQEYMCCFTAMSGLVYPTIDSCYQTIDPKQLFGQQVGGIDWGWRNPFAAIWGTIVDDVLYIHGERYMRQTALHTHAAELPRIMWYADPAGRTEIEEFRSAGHLIRRGNNAIRLGIAAVSCRINEGRIKIDPKRCPNLTAEAALYRYPDDKERVVYGENPIDDNNHALGALRYLISRIDARYLATMARKQTTEGPIEQPASPAPTRSSTMANFFADALEDAEWTQYN
jgi:hypothetical protein